MITLNFLQQKRLLVVGSYLLHQNSKKQQCIPVGWVPSAAVAVSQGGGLPGGGASAQGGVSARGCLPSRVSADGKKHQEDLFTFVTLMMLISLFKCMEHRTAAADVI